MFRPCSLYFVFNGAKWVFRLPGKIVGCLYNASKAAVMIKLFKVGLGLESGGWLGLVFGLFLQSG